MGVDDGRPSSGLMVVLTAWGEYSFHDFRLYKDIKSTDPKTKQILNVLKSKLFLQLKISLSKAG